jgi:excisionase family DNA binding protein
MAANRPTGLRGIKSATNFKGVEMRVRAFVESGQQAATASTPVEDELYELLTVDEVASLFKVSKSWVYEHTRGRGTERAERLPHVKIGKYVRFEARAVRAYVEKKCRVV